MKLKNIFVIGIISFTVSATAYAGSVGTLTTFSSGTTAKASEVNANFTAVKTAVDGNAEDVEAIEAELDGKLDITGGTMTGNLTVPKVVYSTARTHVICISGSMFMPADSDDAYKDAAIGRYITAGSGILEAQANLPDGAVITGITFYIYDNDSTNNLNPGVIIQTLSTGGLTSLSNMTSSGASTTVQTLSDTEAGATVNNSTSAILVRAYGGTWSDDLTVVGAVITYTLSEAQ